MVSMVTIRGYREYTQSHTPEINKTGDDTNSDILGVPKCLL